MKDRLDAILRRSQAAYLDSLTPPRDALLEHIEKFAAEHRHPIADPEVAQLVRILIAVRQPRRILEGGTNIGYSVIVMGRAAGEGAVVETIDIDRRTLDTARGFVAEANLPARVIFHEGAALEVLPGLAGPFDFVFIDCVKTEYEQYLDSLLPKLEKGAVLVYDNLLWKGQVGDGVHDEWTDALRAFNRRITTDSRLETIVLAVGDGTGISVVR
jgi:predicted O-methyltransferase YrrM